MGRVLFCRACGRGTVFAIGVITACRTCGANVWRSIDQPQRAYVLTVQDRAFLRSIKISAS